MRRRKRKPISDSSGLLIGTRFSGRPLVVPRPSGNPSHALISGETGSGKTELQRAWIGAAAGLPDVAFVGMDPKLTALRLWSPRFTAVATTVPACTELMVLLWREVFRRFDIMDQAGIDEWHPTLGGPYIVVPIDELTEVVTVDGTRVADELGDHMASLVGLEPTTAQMKAHTDALKKELTSAKTLKEAQAVFLSSLARVCRSSGVTILAATQYPTVDVLDAQVKANLAIRVMLRVASQEMVGVCLGLGYGSEISARSISPNEPGGCWITGLEGRAIRARGLHITPTQARIRAAQTSTLRHPPDGVFISQTLPDSLTATPPKEQTNELHALPTTR